ncbi:MAG: adenine deaminase [Johnsonella sp.]|nr:adenine deaminase [Johnsonella sp.]
MDKKDLKKLIDIAMGRQKADLLIKNCKIVDLCGGEIIEGDLAIADGLIAGIGDYEAENIYDAKGKYATAGFIDAHIHIESSYCSPEEFAKMVVVHGTTGVIADPHEIMNVCGLEGYRYMREAAKKTPLSVKYMMSSCVPATKYEDAGAVISAEDMEGFLEEDDIPGLAEFMDYQAVISAEDGALDKIMLAKRLGKVIDGHSPSVFGKELNAYVSAGIKTDHECSTPEEMKDRIQRGMYVQLRQGSACHNLPVLMDGINDYNYRRCLLCSDDRQPKTFFEEGHLNAHIKMLIRAGKDPIKVLCMASSNAADCYGLQDRGILAPGKRADIVLFDNFEDFHICEVFIEGKLVAKDGKYLLQTEKQDISPVSRSMHLKEFCAEDLKMRLKSPDVYAIEMIPGGVLSKKAKVRADLNEEGDFVYNPKKDLVKAAVLERHHATGKIGLGLIKGYGMKCGALAASVAHDSHNIICVGTDNEEMETAIKALCKQDGGFVIVKKGEVIAKLALPIAGLMSDLDSEEVAQKLNLLHETALKELGVNPELEPVMGLTFMSLMVIPELKLTARGLFDVGENRFIEMEQ